MTASPTSTRGPLESAAPSASPGMTLPLTTRAVLHRRYGGPDSLQVGERRIEALEPDQVLVRVRASSVNPADWYGVEGFWVARLGNGLRAPKSSLVGLDLAGEIVAVGSGVTAFRVGDEVFGSGLGAWAEHAVALEKKLAHKPPSVSFEDAASIPVAGLTALQALRDKGGVGPGIRVLVNGASGGVGTFAVQLARWLGGEVTAVCSTQNVELARSLGATRVVDYRNEDFCRLPERYDVLIDVAGSRALRELGRVLTRKATVVLVGAPMTARGLGPLPHLVGTLLAGKLRRRAVRFFVAHVARDDLELMGRLLAEGAVRAVIDRRYDGLDAAADAHRHLGEGHARGKIVVAM